MNTSGRRSPASAHFQPPALPSSVRPWPLQANTPLNGAHTAPPKQTGRKHIMFGLRAKRRDTHYREAMRQLQPFANEANALWLSGHYRGIQALIPGMSFQPRIRQTRDC